MLNEKQTNWLLGFLAISAVTLAVWTIHQGGNVVIKYDQLCVGLNSQVVKEEVTYSCNSKQQSILNLDLEFPSLTSY